MLDGHLFRCYVDLREPGGLLMEIRVLRYFLAVAREGTIVGAAKFLHVTQPTLSRQLQDLEEELGQQLFIRSNRTITLTPEGRFLRKRAEEILEIVNRTEGDFNAMGENIGGSVHIGGGESRAMRLVAGTIGELREEHPDIRYNLYSGNAEDVMERLDKGILDFGILIQPVDISKYDSVALPIRDTWGLVMRKDSPLAEKTAITLRDLRSLPLICSRINIRQSAVKNAYAEWFGKSFEKLNIVATYNLIYNAALLVEAGIGYALGLDGLIDAVGNRALCFRPLEPKLESGLNIVWKKYQVFSKAAELFREQLLERFSEPETES